LVHKLGLVKNVPLGRRRQNTGAGTAVPIRSEAWEGNGESRDGHVPRLVRTRCVLETASFRSLPIGAEPCDSGRTHFRVWAPRAKLLEVAIEESALPDVRREFFELESEGGGYFSGFAPAGPGALYRFRLDGSEHLHPDPASRFQPEGPHRSSCVIDPGAYRWRDENWRGVPLRGQVIYEMHVGTFTHEGTWSAALRELPELARLGVTVIEVMPVAEFSGKFGWGYDGVDLFAPTHRYGAPDDLRAFVDAAHAAGLAVILDVVYNHLGPDGNYLPVYSRDYFTDRYKCEWGEPLNFDGTNSAPVREFFVANACHWVREYHLDGFRFDATQQIFDHSEQHIVCEIGLKARESAAGRELLLIAENEPQEAKWVRPCDAGGYGLDAVWNDDFHHSARVALTGSDEAYYTDYRGLPQEFISAAKYGFLFQGQHYKWQKKRRGTPAFGIPPAAFVTFIENHDQVANSPFGARLCSVTSPGKLRAMTALLLLGPGTPMLFQGQEFGSTAPFCYFCDMPGELQPLVEKGRLEFISQFPSIASEETQRATPRPSDQATFARCKLDLNEREKNSHCYRMHADLLRLRREDPAFGAQRLGGIDGAVLGPDAFVLRYFGEAGDDRLLIVNFGRRLHLDTAPEPLLAPPVNATWKTLWSSDSVQYGGPGPTALESGQNWILPAESATALAPEFDSVSKETNA
jgi:maltooligosyltrehalose trehalohydrolase